MFRLKLYLKRQSEVDYINDVVALLTFFGRVVRWDYGYSIIEKDHRFDTGKICKIPLHSECQYTKLGTGIPYAAGVCFCYDRADHDHGSLSGRYVSDLRIVG